MAKLFSKEKDIVLKVINSILVIWLIAAIVITFGVGIRIFNKDVTLSYSDYSKQICDLDKIPTEEIDQQTIKDNCYASYIAEKKENESYNKALKITEALFSGDIASLSENELKDALSGVQTETITEEMNIVDMLVNTKILSSKREAREFINNGSISINGEKINTTDMLVNKEKALYNKYIVVRRGKKKYYLVIFN